MMHTTRKKQLWHSAGQARRPRTAALPGAPFPSGGIDYQKEER